MVHVLVSLGPGPPCRYSVRGHGGRLHPMPLVGRDRSLQQLADCAAAAASGFGRLVVVAGEAGVGKSTLVEALRAELDGVRWLTGAPGRSTSSRSIWTPSANLPGRRGWIRCSAG